MNAYTSVSMCVNPCCMVYVHMFFSFSHDPHAHTALAHRPMSIKGKSSLLIAVNPQRCVDVSKALQSLLKDILCSSHNINLTDKFKKKQTNRRKNFKNCERLVLGKKCCFFNACEAACMCTQGTRRRHHRAARVADEIPERIMYY